MKKSLYLLPIVMLLNACEKAFFEADMASSDSRANFEYLWKEVDEKYAFFDVKNVDWNEVYRRYTSRIYPDMDEDELFLTLGSMLNELKDGHVNLVSHFNVSQYPIDLLGPDNFDFRIIREYYLSDNFYVSGPFVHDFLADEQLGYLRFSEFSGAVDTLNMAFILERYKNTRGLIVDIRENGGGTPLDIYEILGHFVDTKTHLFDSRIKNGPGHSDFSELQAASVSPSEQEAGIYRKPVAVLTDRGSFSASSFFALATKALPNIILIGDTTGGGLGLPTGGQLPNGWQFRLSITQALDLQGNNYENGVPPDITVTMQTEDWLNGTDPILERAIQELLF